jgi:4-hydroxybenzoate polyprenyltransferase
MHIILDGLGDKVATMIQWMTTFVLALIIAFISGWKLALVSLIFCPAIIFVGYFMVWVCIIQSNLFEPNL